MENNKLPDSMRVRLRQYFHQRKNLHIMSAAAEVVSKLSSSLQVEVIMHCNGEWIRKVRFLQGAETGCIVQVARGMHPIVFSPHELPPPRTLYVIRSGIVLRNSAILTSNEVFGEDVCVEDPGEEITPTRCMTYVEVLALSQSRLFQIISSFARAQKLVRRIEVLYLLRRSIMRVARQARELARRTNGETRDFVSRLIDASTDQARQALMDAGGFIESEIVLDDSTSASDRRFLALEKEVAGLRTDVRELIAEIRAQPATPMRAQPQASLARGAAVATTEAAAVPGVVARTDGSVDGERAELGAQQHIEGMVARALAQSGSKACP